MTVRHEEAACRYSTNTSDSNTLWSLGMKGNIKGLGWLAGRNQLGVWEDSGETSRKRQQEKEYFLC